MGGYFRGVKGNLPHIKINWNHQEAKLTMENAPKANEQLRVMFCALNGASQRRVTREEKAINNKN